jgi:cellulose synthase/poly-beta-1,6-N-acetylglucosamine synthase-like glycosyltransferase
MKIGANPQGNRSYDEGGPLDAVREPHHWTYKIPGSLVWLMLLCTMLALTEAPALALAGIRVLGLYVLFRVLVSVFFYPIGLLRCRWQVRRWQSAQTEERQAAGDAIAAVHHVVVVPNYREPLAILERTVAGLAAQEEATKRLTVVLAMEAADPEAEHKAEALLRRYAGCFANLLVTHHPANLPGEAPGKASNQRWAAVRARNFLVEKQGMALENLTLTSCDADSLIHPGYFAVVSRQFAGDPERHYRFWQTWLRFDNNIWRVSSPIRVLTLMANMLNLSELANPFVVKLTQSTYTFSYKLAEAVDYWDTQVVAEDSHIFLRAFFGTRGRASVQPIFLPTSGDAVIGADFVTGLRNFYKQRTRHAWACQNTAYVLQQWNRHPEIAFSQKLLYLLQVLQDYSLFGTAAFLLAVGWLLSSVATGSPVVSFFKLAIPAFLFVAVNAIGTAGTWVAWAAGHTRCARDSAGWRPMALVGDLVAWMVLPVITLGLAVLPVIHANTKMLSGSQLIFVRTYKEADQETANG